MLDRADDAAPTRQHELDHTSTDQGYIYLSALKDPYHEVGMICT